MDKGGQTRHHLDEALVRSLRLQPGAPRPVRSRLQPRQFHAPLRPPERGVTLVAFEHTAQAHKDWGQDYQSLQDDHISDGGGGYSGKAVPVDAIENPQTGQGMREGARPEPVKAEENDWWIPMRDNCPRTTGKHEVWG